MLRTLRTLQLGRQPFAIGTTTTTNSPLQRLATQVWKNSSGARSTPQRSIQTSARGKNAAGFPGWAASTPFLRSQQAWRSGTTNFTGRVFERTQKRNFSWSWSRRSQASGGKAEESLSLSGRLKKLSREYGWCAVGVYIGLSVLDFPFCFLLVKWVGTERICKCPYC